MALDYKRYRFTVKEYEAMGRAGIFDEDDRVELLDGEIVEMTPIGGRHFLATVRTQAAFHAAFAGAALVSTQNPVRLAKRSEPQPDLALVRLDVADIPGTEDVLLLVEVADTSAEVDRHKKIPIYGRAGIREVWLLDLDFDVVEIYQDPTPRGYRSVRIARRGESIAPEALPDRPVAVSDLLPSPDASTS